jgi:hypothetical protein
VTESPFYVIFFFVVAVIPYNVFAHILNSKLVNSMAISLKFQFGMAQKINESDTK